MKDTRKWKAMEISASRLFSSFSEEANFQQFQDVKKY